MWRRSDFWEVELFDVAVTISNDILLSDIYFNVDLGLVDCSDVVHVDSLGL